MCIHHLTWRIRGKLGMTNMYEVKLKLVDGSSYASDYLVKVKQIYATKLFMNIRNLIDLCELCGTLQMAEWLICELECPGWFSGRCWGLRLPLFSFSLLCSSTPISSHKEMQLEFSSVLQHFVLLYDEHASCLIQSGHKLTCWARGMLACPQGETDPRYLKMQSLPQC